MRKRAVLFLSLVALFAILMMLNFTTPMEVGPFGVLVFFTMIYILFFGFSTWIGTIISKILNKGKNLSNKGYFYIITTSFAPVLFLLMRSFDMEMVFAAILSIVFVVLGCVLVKKRF